MMTLHNKRGKDKMIYAIFFKQFENEEEGILENENIHSQFINFVPRVGESIELIDEYFEVIKVHYHIDESETFAQIMLKSIDEQC